MVSNFAKDTGDYKSLSRTDMRVIALGVQLAREKGEFAKLKREPKPLQEFRPRKFQQDYDKMEQVDEDEEDSEEESNNNKLTKPADAFDDGFTQVQASKHGSRKNHLKPKPVPQEEATKT